MPPVRLESTRNIRLPRILHLIDVGGTGGAETVFVELARHYHRLGQNAGVVLPSTGWIQRQLEAAGVPFLVIPSSGSMSGRLLGSLLRVCCKAKPDVILAHLIGSGVYASLAGLFLRIPVVVVFHGAWDIQEPGRLAWVKRSLLQRSHVTVVAVSGSVKSSLVRWGIDPDSVRVLMNGVDTGRFHPSSDRTVLAELGIGAEQMVIGAVGNLHPIKGYEVLIRAASVLVASGRRVHFIVAGDGDAGYRSGLEALRDSLGLRDRVHFLGFRAATPGLYSSMHVLASAAHSEGLPLSFLEAMACNVPVVATANDGSSALIQATGGGRTVTPGDHHALARVLGDLLDDEPLRGDLGRRGREAVQESFALTRTLQAYTGLLAEMARGSRT